MKNKEFGMIGEGATIMDPKLKTKALINGNIFFSTWLYKLNVPMNTIELFDILIVCILIYRSGIEFYSAKHSTECHNNRKTAKGERGKNAEKKES